MSYQATYSFNVRRHLRVTIDADSPEEAERIAKADAMKHIDTEIVAIQNSDGFSDTERLEPYLYLDACDDGTTDVLCEEALPDPEGEALSVKPAIAALIEYAAEAPAILCGEGFWDDMDSACGDGMRTERSEAADLIRDALRALGIDPPEGVAVCPECYEPVGSDHHHQCPHDGEDVDPEELFEGWTSRDQDRALANGWQMTLNGDGHVSIEADEDATIPFAGENPHLSAYQHVSFFAAASRNEVEQAERRASGDEADAIRADYYDLCRKAYEIEQRTAAERDAADADDND